MRAICLMAFAFASAGAAAQDAGLKAQARALLDRHAPAMVTVKLVVTARAVVGGQEGQQEEYKFEVNGTVVDPSGLTVLSCAQTDPFAETDDPGSAPRDADEGATRSEVTDVKIVTADGTEMPARVVLQDRDLDLAFVRPKRAPARPPAHLPLARAAEPGILDPVLVLSRLGREAGRECAVAAGHVQAVVKKPRTFFVCSGDLALPGCPVFSASGETLGLCVMRRSPVPGAGGPLPVVLPAEDVLEAATQALAEPEDKGAKRKENGGRRMENGKPKE